MNYTSLFETLKIRRPRIKADSFSFSKHVTISYNASNLIFNIPVINPKNLHLGRNYLSIYGRADGPQGQFVKASSKNLTDQYLKSTKLVSLVIKKKVSIGQFKIKGSNNKITIKLTLKERRELYIQM